MSDPDGIPSDVTPEFADYSILKVIGEGGMGKVYLAEDTRLQRQVAIKVLLPDRFGLGFAKTLEEARALAKVNHPNVVQIYNVVEEGACIALVMEYLTGDTLAHLQRQRLLSLEQKLDLLAQTGEGLQAVHSAGLVHGDIKASNVWVTERGVAKVVDFGLARVFPDQVANPSMPTTEQQADERFGSFRTLSPEGHTDGPLDAQSDLFSFGVVAYELIAGHSPFGEGSYETIRRRVLNDEREDAAHILPEVPQALASLLNQLLQHDRSARPESFEAVGERLSRISDALVHASILSQATVPLDGEMAQGAVPHGRWRAWSRRWFFTVAAACVAAAAMSLGYWWFELRNPGTRYVLVLRPTISDDSSIDAKQQDLVVASIDDALRQAVLTAGDVQLIPSREIAHIEGSPSTLGEAVAATDVIATGLTCDAQHCDVTFERITHDAWTVQGQKQWSTQIESATSLYSSAQSMLVEIFPELSSAKLSSGRVPDQEYNNYVELYYDIKFRGIETRENLARLRELISAAPHLYSAYDLYRESALRLYLFSNSEYYTDSLRELLQSAPPEYRNSLAHSVASFWLAVYARDFDKALASLELARQRGANNVTLIELRAAYFFQKGEYGEAIRTYEQALALRFSTSHLYNLALCHWYSGEVPLAKSRLSQLLEIVPDYHSANQLMASALLLEGSIPEAIAAYENLVSINPQSMDLNNLALAYSLARNYPAARAMAELAVSQSPESPEYLLNLADMEMLAGSGTRARQIYRQVDGLLEEKADLDSLLMRAQVAAHLGEELLAVKAVNASNRLSPNNGEVAFTSALVYSLLNEHSSALVKVEEALGADVGTVWFGLPWFDGLCETAEFRSLMSSHGFGRRCVEANVD